MLTPSPNPDTDVLLPPPSFTLGQGHGRSRGTLLASRQHPIRKSSVFSDMDEDSPGGSIDDPPLVPTHSSSGGKSYPGMAIPVLQKTHSHFEVGPEAKDKSKARGEATTDTRPADLFDATSAKLTPSRFFQECFPLRDTSNIKDLPHLDTSHSLDEVELSSSLTPDYLQDQLIPKSAPQSRGTSPSTNKLSSMQSFILSPKKSPVKSSPIPIPKKPFSSHNRSKSSVALKPEKTFEVTQSARDDISLLQRDTSNMSLGSNIYELLSKTTQVSPSHTEMCLTYMPKKPEAPSSWERSRGHGRNEHLFTSRSLERPSTPKHNKHLSSIHKVSSLPLQHTRDRSPSPIRNQSHWRLERQTAQIIRENTYDLKDSELGKLRRTLTHEEEINLILSGDPNYLTKMKSPDSFTPPELVDGDGMMNYNSYEMKF